MRVCLTCGSKDSARPFVKNRNQCKQCRNKYCREWHANNLDKAHEYHKSWYGKPENKLKKRLYNIKLVYGLEESDFLSLLSKQGGVCGLCRRPMDFKNPKVVHVDHDHKTGRVRGILHSKCNRGLHFIEDKVWRAAAETYLSAHSDQLNDSTNTSALADISNYGDQPTHNSIRH